VNIIDEQGFITHRGVHLDVSGRAFFAEYGIDHSDLSALMGYPSEYPGGRARSHLYASFEMGEDVVFITLGETGHDGRIGAINIYYNGDRIFSDDKVMHWERFAQRLPPTRRPVVKAGEQLCFEFSYADCRLPEPASDDEPCYRSAPERFAC
jgi:hypothetical protein